MWDWIKSTFDTLARYFLDLFVWLFEFIFWVFDEILRFLFGLAKPLLLSCFDAVSSHVPSELFDVIVGSYAWLQYINEWVPIGFGIKLVGAYYGIAFFFFGFRAVLAFLPWGGSKI